MATGGGFDYTIYLRIAKTAELKIDLPPNRRCDPTPLAERPPSNGVSECTLQYLERLAGCSMPWERNYNSSASPTACKTLNQYLNYTGEVFALQDFNENEYFLRTGCLVPCNRSTFELRDGQDRVCLMLP